jgi:hypothetical protein
MHHGSSERISILFAAHSTFTDTFYWFASTRTIRAKHRLLYQIRNAVYETTVLR